MKQTCSHCRKPAQFVIEKFRMNQLLTENPEYVSACCGSPLYKTEAMFHELSNWFSMLESDRYKRALLIVEYLRGGKI